MTLSGVQEDVDISHQHDILTPTSTFDIMDTNASDSKSVHDDGNIVLVMIIAQGKIITVIMKILIWMCVKK